MGVSISTPAYSPLVPPPPREGGDEGRWRPVATMRAMVEAELVDRGLEWERRYSSVVL